MHTAIQDAEYKSEFEYTNGTPQLTLTGELWGAFCEDLEKIDCVMRAPYGTGLQCDVSHPAKQT